MNNPNIVELNISGAESCAIDATILADLRHSLLAKSIYNPDYRKVYQGKIFIDRDPQSFKLMLTYLRNGRKFKP